MIFNRSQAFFCFKIMEICCAHCGFMVSLFYSTFTLCHKSFVLAGVLTLGLRPEETS